ncbi:MAG: hypothetical protein ACJ0SL_05090 [Candidatus Rariloculaceae bacterium]
METLADDGSTVVWLGETKASTQLYRAGLEPDIFHVGDTVRMAGFRGRRNKEAMFVTNVLLRYGSELIAENLAGPRWTENVAGTALADYQAQRIETTAAAPSTLFRVWSRDGFVSGADDTERMLWVDSYPLTAEAAATQASWDPVAKNPYIHCQNGMPAIMDQGFPLEFVQEGDEIVLTLEELDTKRRIYMNGSGNRAIAESTAFGYSTGRWDGDTLEVTTVDINWPWLDQSGIPQTDALRIVERFTPSEDGWVLNYQLTATDPEIFTEPVVLSRIWIWVPGEVIRTYNCSWDRQDL